MQAEEWCCETVGVTYKLRPSRLGRVGLSLAVLSVIIHTK